MQRPDLERDKRCGIEHEDPVMSCFHDWMTISQYGYRLKYECRKCGYVMTPVDVASTPRGKLPGVGRAMKVMR